MLVLTETSYVEVWKHSHSFVSIQLVLYIHVSHFLHVGSILGMLPHLLLQKAQAAAFPCMDSITACTSDCPQTAETPGACMLT